MILYEDNDILVCHKPEGIAVQSARLGEKDMVSILNNYLAEQRTASGKTGVETVHVVHRLDQPVEGVIVFAKTKRAAAGLTRQITDGSMEKVYHAVCCPTEKAKERFFAAAVSAEDASAEGVLDDEEETYELVDYLVKDSRTNTSSVGRKGQKDAKEARLSFRILRRGVKDGAFGYLLTEIHLETGRHHQIRVQMAHAGLPLYGDRKYNPDMAQAKGASSLGLCAASLTFVHPVTKKRMQFSVQPEKKIFREFEVRRA